MIPGLMFVLLLGVVGCCLAIAETDHRPPYVPTPAEPVNEAEAWRQYHREGVAIERERRQRQWAEMKLHIIAAAPRTALTPAPVVLIGRPPRELVSAA